MYSCSVSGCDNSSENCSEEFYPFPADFDLCALWIQTCGKADYFEDFAYGGALPFITRKICASHFNPADFLDPNSRALGLKEGVVPIGNFTASDIVIKNEICDIENTVIENAVYIPAVENEEAFIKEEPFDNDDCLNDDDYLSEEDDDDVDDDLSQSPLPLLVIAREKLIWKKKPPGRLSQSTFRSTWSQALQNVEIRERPVNDRRPFETEEERRKRNEENARRIALKRANETHQDRKDRLYKNAVRAALRRSLETEEQQRERRLKNALRAAYRRSVETPEQRTERRRKDLLRSARRRREETELQAKIRKYNDAVRAAFRRRNETPEQRQQRKMIDVLRAARRRSMENPEQREARLKSDRERAARRRLLKKLQQLPSDLPEYVDPNLASYGVNIVKVETPGSVADSDSKYDSPAFVDINELENEASVGGLSAIAESVNDKIDANEDNNDLKPEFVWCS